MPYMPGHGIEGSIADWWRDIMACFTDDFEATYQGKALFLISHHLFVRGGTEYEDCFARPQQHVAQPARISILKRHRLVQWY